MTDAAGPALLPVEPPAWKRNAALFLIGQTSVLFGSAVVELAVLWHLTLTTGSGTVVMWWTIFAMVPQAATSLFGGVWADRYSRKLLIIGSNSVVAAVSLVLAFLMLNGVDALWVIYLTIAIRSAFAGIQQPTVAAVLPQIVPAKQLLRVNGIDQTLFSILMLVSPAAAGALLAAAGIHTAFFLDVATAIVGIALLAAVPIARVGAGGAGDAASAGADADGDHDGVLTELAAGLRYVARHSSVRWLMVLLGTLLLLGGAPMLLTTLMVARTFGGEVWMVSGNEIAWGAGGLLGGLVVAALADKLTNRVAIIIASVIGTGTFTLLLGVSTNLWVFYAFGLLLAFAVGFEATPTMTVLQETVEPEMQGRVFGFHSVVMGVAMPISMIIFGPLSDHFSVEALLIAAGILLLVFMLAMLAIPATRRSLAAISRSTAAAPAES